MVHINHHLSSNGFGVCEPLSGFVVRCKKIFAANVRQKCASKYIF